LRFSAWTALGPSILTLTLTHTEPKESTTTLDSTPSSWWAIRQSCLSITLRYCLLTGHCPFVAAILLGQVDREAERQVSTEEGAALAQKWKSPFYETSALTGVNIHEAFAGRRVIPALVALIDDQCPSLITKDVVKSTLQVCQNEKEVKPKEPWEEKKRKCVMM